MSVVRIRIRGATRVGASNTWRDAIRALTLRLVVAMAGILLLGLGLFVRIAFRGKPPKPRLLAGQSPRDHGADAEIEDHDIDQMIEARNERRRRLGKPEIGDERAAALERESRRPR